MVRQFVKQLACTMFISNNRQSFHLWWKENLVNHLKLSKYYETDCLQSFLLLFMLLLTAKFAKHSHILARIFIIFLKNVLKKTWNSLNTKFQLQWKDRENSNQIRPNFRTYILLNGSNFKLKQCERPQSYQTVPRSEN